MNKAYEEFYEQISMAIGDVCFCWSNIETLVHEFILHLSICGHEAFEQKPVYETLHTVISLMDFRQKISVAKVLAHSISDPKDFYDRAEKILNMIDNELRPERNRYVHDIWESDEGKIVRRRLDPKVTRPQSRQRQLTMVVEHPFADIGEVRQFIKKLSAAWTTLLDLDNETAAIVSKARNEELSPPPLLGSND